ncbi:MAG: hypothetical protein Q8R18_06620 [bacterium]|nr:hypothetical protein [bacterium]
MAHMTLSIPDPLYKEIKKHKEIRWSEAARKGIILELLHVQKEIHGRDLLSLFSKKTQETIDSLRDQSKEDSEQWLKKMRERDRKRIRS